MFIRPTFKKAAAVQLPADRLYLPILLTSARWQSVTCFWYNSNNGILHTRSPVPKLA